MILFQIVLESHHSPLTRGYIPNSPLSRRFIPIPPYQGGRQGGVILYSWGLVPEIRITDFRDSHTDHTDTPQLCREVVHWQAIADYSILLCPIYSWLYRRDFWKTEPKEEVFNSLKKLPIDDTDLPIFGHPGRMWRSRKVQRKDQDGIFLTSIKL